MASAEEMCAPAPKRTRLEEQDLCAICDKPFSKNNPAVYQNPSRLQTLVQACKDRNDDVGKKLLSKDILIMKGSIEIKYHRSCRSSYCSSEHVLRLSEKHNVQSMLKDVYQEYQTLSAIHVTRSSVSELNWNENCFICGEKCHEKLRKSNSNRNWSTVQTVIDNKGENIFNKVLGAAKKKE